MMPPGLLLPLLAAAISAGRADDSRSEPTRFDVSKPLACNRIVGYEKYIELPNGELTSDDKLLVYFRPLNFKVEPVEKPKPGARYRARFSQDGQIRRKGEKAVLMKKDKILEYEPTFEAPDERIYLTNTVGLKGLPPGEYEYDLILRDDLGAASTLTGSLSFTIIPIPKVAATPKDEGPAGPEGPTGPSVEAKSKKSKKSGRRP